MNDVYYEVENTNTPADGLPNGVTAFDDLDSAIEYAEANGCDLICEVGGSWDEYRKCWFCEEWKSTAELNKNDLCEKCENYLISRGEI